MKKSQSDTRKQWLAIYTRSHCEKKVARYLFSENIEHYCPLVKVVRQWSDRKKVIMEPLFTSYVFVKLAQEDHTLVKRIDGAVTLVQWLGKPAIIQDEEIEVIKNFLSDHPNAKLSRIPVNVQDTVRVVRGPLMEHCGQVVAVKSKTVKVILPSFRNILSAEFQLTDIELVPKKCIL